MKFSPRKDLLSYEEMLFLLEAASEIGINKVRITGGEPFLKRDMVYFLEEASKIKGLKKIAITTNGVLTHQYIDDLIRLNIKSINLSLDTLDPVRFYDITRKNVFPQVMETLDALLKNEFDLKINAVLMYGKNTDDLPSLLELSKNNLLNLRFIEEMPFNGSGRFDNDNHWTYKKILEEIKVLHPTIQKLTDAPHSTSLNYQVPGYKGSVGIIPAWSRTFCGSCNRLRVTAKGMLKTCLYDNGGISLKQLLSNGASKKEIQKVIIESTQNRHKNGFDAEKDRGSNRPISESMSAIGG